jgi:hypothetical protein
MGNSEALPRGSVQYLSAGTGITHSVGGATLRPLPLPLRLRLPLRPLALLQRAAGACFPPRPWQLAAAGGASAPRRRGRSLTAAPPPPAFAPAPQEMNDQDETCRFLQIWFTPDK